MAKVAKPETAFLDPKVAGALVTWASLPEGNSSDSLEGVIRESLCRKVLAGQDIIPNQVLLHVLDSGEAGKKFFVTYVDTLTEATTEVTQDGEVFDQPLTMSEMGFAGALGRQMVSVYDEAGEITEEERPSANLTWTELHTSMVNTITQINGLIETSEE